MEFEDSELAKFDLTKPEVVADMVVRCLCGEESVIPFAEAPHAIPETGSSGGYKSLGGQVSKLKKVPEPVRPFPRLYEAKFRGAPLTDLGRSAN